MGLTAFVFYRLVDRERLMGDPIDQWLIQAGFDINQPVTVRMMDKCLVLTTD